MYTHYRKSNFPAEYSTLSRIWRLRGRKCRVLPSTLGPLAGRPENGKTMEDTGPYPARSREAGPFYIEASPFACGSAMIFFKYNFLRHFCGATFEFSQHCRESGVSLRKSGAFYRVAGDTMGPIQGKRAG